MSTYKQITVSNKEISNYWKSVANTNSRDLLEKTGDNTFEIILESEGKHCFACGIKCRPHRAHIIADSLGGLPTVDNLFLLCIPCHQSNPDTTDTKLFFNYVRNKPSYVHTLIGETYKNFNNLYKDATDVEKSKIHAFNDASQEQRTKLIAGIDGMSFTNSLNNVVTNATLTGVVWNAVLAE